jgi:uncharacterized protein YndB with AHSA1/START domain
MTSVRLQRILPAPPAEVYRAWLDPELLLRWSAPVEYDAVRVEVEDRVGGHYRCWHVDAEGRDVGGYDCTILELVPDERIVLQWQFVGPDRTADSDASSRLTITLRPVAPDACELTLVHDRLDGLERSSPGFTDAVRGGWTGTMARLDAAIRARSERTSTG